MAVHTALLLIIHAFIYGELLFMATCRLKSAMDSPGGNWYYIPGHDWVRVVWKRPPPM